MTGQQGLNVLTPVAISRSAKKPQVNVERLIFDYPDAVHLKMADIEQGIPLVGSDSARRRQNQRDTR